MRSSSSGTPEPGLLLEERGLAGYNVKISRAGTAPDWDAFVASCAGAHYEQTTLWAKVKQCYGWAPLRVVLLRGDEIAGGAQVLVRPFGRLGRIGHISRGPVAASDDPRLIEAILRGVDRALSAERLTYVAIVPPEHGSCYEPGLSRLGYRRKPNALPPGGVMTATLTLDLSANLDNMIARARRNMRRNLHRAVVSGVKVREGGESDVQVFRDLMWALCDRRGVSPTPPQRDFFEQTWRVFRPSGNVQIFLAEVGGQVVSALFTFPFGDTMRTWKAGWAGDHAGLGVNEMLYWEAIKWAKVRGLRSFDFVGIERSFAQMLERGDLIDWTNVSGPDNFKASFGGKAVVVPEPYYRFYAPFLQVCARAGGKRLLESPLAAPLLGRLGSSAA